MVYIHYLDCVANFIDVLVLKYVHRFSDTPPFKEWSLSFLPRVRAALSDLLLTGRIKIK